MSRYTITFNDKYISYGFDPPIASYFIQVEIPAPQVQIVDEGEDYILFEVDEGHFNNPLSGGGLLQLLSNEEVLDQIPEDHKTKMAMDLPF